MSRDASLAIVVGLLFVAVLVALGVGLSGMSETITSSGPVGSSPPDPPADSSSGVVYDLQSTPGLNIVGLSLRSSAYVAQVALVVPPQCVSLDNSGREELLTEGICADLPVNGELSGGGVTAAGLKLAIVSVKVSKPCYEALSIGAAWPSVAEECAAE